MFVDNNLLADIWMHLKPALTCRIEALCMILGNRELHLHRITLSIEKYFKAMHSHVHTHLGMYIKTRDLTLIIPDIKHSELVTILLNTWNS